MPGTVTPGAGSVLPSGCPERPPAAPSPCAKARTTRSPRESSASLGLRVSGGILVTMKQEWAPLVDVSGMTLEDIMLQAEPGSPIYAATERVIKSLDDPDGIISAFQSYIQ